MCFNQIVRALHARTHSHTCIHACTHAQSFLAHAHWRFNHDCSHYSSKSITADRKKKTGRNENKNMTLMWTKEMFALNDIIVCVIFNFIELCFKIRHLGSENSKYTPETGTLKTCSSEKSPHPKSKWLKVALRDGADLHTCPGGTVITHNKFETHLSWCCRCSLGKVWAPLRAAAGYQEMELPPPPRWMSGPCCWACSHRGKDPAAAGESGGDAADCCCWQRRWFGGAAAAAGDGGDGAGNDEAARDGKWSDVRRQTEAARPQRTCQRATCPPSACSGRVSGCCTDPGVVGTSSGRRALRPRAASLPPSRARCHSAEDGAAGSVPWRADVTGWRMRSVTVWLGFPRAHRVKGGLTHWQAAAPIPSRERRHWDSPRGKYRRDLCAAACLLCSPHPHREQRAAMAFV